MLSHILSETHTTHILLTRTHIHTHTSSRTLTLKHTHNTFMVHNTHTATHLADTLARVHTLSVHTHAHTRVSSHAHTFVYSHARGCVSNPHPRPAGWFVLKLLTARQSGKLRARLSRGGAPIWSPRQGEAGTPSALVEAVRRALGAVGQGLGRLEGGESIPTVLPGHGSLSWACLSTSSFSLGSLNFFSVKLLFVEGSQCARCLARGPAGHPASLRGGGCSSPASLKQQWSPGPGE